MDELSLRFSRFFIEHRRINIILIGAATVYFGWEALQLQVFSQFIDLLPRNHPYIQVYENYNRQFGSANIVTAAIVARDGTIYDESVLEKIYGFTDQIDKVDGVDHGQVSSIMSIGIRNQEVDREGILRSQQIVGEESLALLEAQFFARRALSRVRAAGASVDSLDEFKAVVANRKAELALELAASAALRLDKMEDRAQAEAIQRLREEAAELEFLALRLGELPEAYRLDGELLKGPQGTLIPAALIESLPDRIHQNKQVYGRLVSLDDTAALV